MYRILNSSFYTFIKSNIVESGVKHHKPKPTLIPHSTNIVLCCRSVVKYGELELFLCGLDLSDYVNLFQQQHVDFSIINLSHNVVHFAMNWI
jgi:hypothetical protein